MKNYEQAWKALENRERFIESELKQPGLSVEKRSLLEAEKRKVGVCKQALIREFKGDGDREYEVAKQPKEAEANETRPETNELEQTQTRQARLEREHLRDLEIRKWAERQMG